MMGVERRPRLGERWSAAASCWRPESTMAATSWCISAAPPPMAHPPAAAGKGFVGGRGGSGLAGCSSIGGNCQGVSMLRRSPFGGWERRRRRASRGVVCMAPEEEKMTRRSPLDFPIEWERPKPGRRPDIFPQFSPMKTPLPPPLPADPPEEDEEEEEKKEEEEDPEKEEEEENPDKPQSMMHRV